MKEANEKGKRVVRGELYMYSCPIVCIYICHRIVYINDTTYVFVYLVGNIGRGRREANA